MSENDLLDFSQQADLSAWDSRQNYCIEIDTIRKALQQARLDKNIHRRYLLLEGFYLALSARMKKKTGGEMLTKHTDAYEEVKKVYKQFLRKQTNSDQLNDLFIDWELELRRDEDSLGLLMGNKSDPNNAMNGSNF